MAAIRRGDRNGEWWVDFRYRGRRVRRRAPDQSRRGAEAHERVLRREFGEDEDVGRDPFTGPAPTFAAFAERWMRDYVATSNRLASRRSKTFALRNHLLPAFGALRLDAITTARIDAFAANVRARGLSAKTVNNLVSMLRCALATAVDWGLLRHVPKVRWLKVPPPVTDHLAPEEVDQLLSVLPEGYWRALVTLIARTGIRFNEAAALRWDDLELDAPCPLAHIDRGVSCGVIGPTKTGILREVPLGPDVVEALRTFRHRDSFIFLQKNGALPNPAAKLRPLHRLCAKAGIRPIGWHTLRHSFATTLVRRRAPLPSVQRLLGHTTLQMTSRYLHVAPSMLQEAVQLLYEKPGPEVVWSPNGHQPRSEEARPAEGIRRRPTISAA